jgi:hypothetical protein
MSKSRYGKANKIKFRFDLPVNIVASSAYMPLRITSRFEKDSIPFQNNCEPSWIAMMGNLKSISASGLKVKNYFQNNYNQITSLDWIYIETHFLETFAVMSYSN